MEPYRQSNNSSNIVPSIIFQIICENITTSEPRNGASTLALVSDVTDAGPSSTEVEQKDALLYIVVVLGFYSFGVILMVVTYLKEEKRNLEEDVILDTFWNNKPPSAFAQRGRISGKLALNAFNAVNLVTQSQSTEGKVITFV